MSKVLFAQVSDDLHRKVKLHVAFVGTSMSGYLQNLVEEDLKEKETNAPSPNLKR